MAWGFILRPLLVLLMLAPLFLSTAASADEPFTEARLQELLQKNPTTGLPVDSISELIPLLPRELRENFT